MDAKSLDFHKFTIALAFCHQCIYNERFFSAYTAKNLQKSPDILNYGFRKQFMGNERGRAYLALFAHHQ